MKNILIIFKREFQSYFNSPIAYIFILAILAICSGLYMTTFFFAVGLAEMRDFFSINSWLMLFFLPAITMRLWSEEQKSGSLALLQSLPMKPYELVVGKFFAGLGFYVLYLIGTLPIPIVIAILGEPDMGPIFGGYLGLFFLGALYTSLGLFFSGLFKDQITAWVMAVIGTIFLHLIGWLPIAAQIDSWIGGFGTLLQRGLGSLSHYEPIYKGVITLNDIIYFVSFIGVFLFLNTLTVEQKMRRKSDLTFTGVAVILIAVATLFNSMVYKVPLGRLDTTEGKIYTISDSAKNIIEQLKTSVTIRYYVTPEDKMPAGMKDIERNITDKLNEFTKISDKVKFEVINPANDNDVITSLSEKGISPFTLRTQERDAVGIKKVYSTLALSYLDKEDDIIPQVMPNSIPSLEYDLCSRMFRMTQDSPPDIAIAAPYDEDPRMNDPQMRQYLARMGQQAPEKIDRYQSLGNSFSQLGYNLSRVDISKAQPLASNLDALMVFDPRNLSERQKYEIAKALYQGTDVILAAQQYKYNYSPNSTGDVMIAPAKNDLALNAFLSNYGVEISDKILMDIQNQIVGIQAQRQVGGFLNIPISIDVQSPVQIRVTPENINQDLAFTSNLGQMVYLWGSGLNVDSSKIESMGLKRTTLFTSSPDTWEVEFTGMPLNADLINPDLHDKVGRKPLGIMIEGQFPNLYENQPPPKWQDETDTLIAAAQVEQLTAKPGRLLIIGGNEIFTDQFIPDGSRGGQRPAHAELIFKAVEGFALSEDLLHIRSKLVQSRPLNNTSPLEKMMWRMFTILLAPAIIIAYGIFRTISRRDRRKAYRRLLEQAGGGV